MKTAFDGPISTFDMVEERINELEDRPIETSQTEIQREKNNLKSKKHIMQELREISKGITYIIGITEGEERDRNRLCI